MEPSIIHPSTTAHPAHQIRSGKDRRGMERRVLTVQTPAPELGVSVLAQARASNRRDEAADLRENAASQREKALRPQELTADLREEAADLREDAADLREISATQREMAVRADSEHSAHMQSQLREANESLVLAALEAQRMKEAAEKAGEQIAQMAKLEAQLQEIQKLETLGILAGGVAHDFNNLLATIVGNADLGSLALGENRDAGPHFDAIEKAAMKAADLTRQLLAYAGKGKYEVKAVDLGIVVQEISLLLHVSIPAQVTLQCDLATALPLVKGDPTQIFQILMNLITNAAEAIPKDTEGQISIRTRAEQIEEGELPPGTWVLPAAPGPYATLEVIDTGAGITPEVLNRIFEPFFTTKFTGRGLGLAAVLGIIRSHGGGLRVLSEPGKGSSFKLFLPVVPNVAATAILTDPALSFGAPTRAEGQIDF